MDGDDGGFHDEYADSDHSILQMIKENNPVAKNFLAQGEMDYIQNMSDDDWEELGRDISNNTHLETLELYEGALNDRKMSCLFRGLTRSSSLDKMILHSYQSICISGVRSMVPFLQHSSKLTILNLRGSIIQSEGFELVFRSLCDSPIEILDFSECGIESFEIDSEHIPKYLNYMTIEKNSVDNDGCRELKKLLRGESATLKLLSLTGNKIDDAGVAILVDALQHNTSLKYLVLSENDGISKQGRIMLLKLVNDISSIEATLKSNHTLEDICFRPLGPLGPNCACPILALIDEATNINSSRCKCNTHAVDKAKVIMTQLDSERRAKLCLLQDVDHSVFSEIDPLYLPEVLALIDHHNGEDELFLALSSSIMTLLSTVNVKKYIQQERAYHAAKLEELDAKLASMEEEEAAAAERNECGTDNECCSDRVESVEFRSNKRRRK